MSYLMLPDGVPDFSKAVISLWFRVPQAAIDKAVAAYKGDGSPLDGIIPLVVMGKSGSDQAPYATSTTSVVSSVLSGWVTTGLTGDVTTTENLGPCPVGPSTNPFIQETTVSNIGVSFVPGEPHYTYQDQHTTTQSGEAPPTNPTFIGVDGAGKLYVNFETGKKPDVSNYDFDAVITPGAVTIFPGGGFAFVQGTFVQTYCFSGLLGVYNLTVVSDDRHNVYYPDGTSTGDPVRSYEDVSSVVINKTEAIYSNQILVTPDTWHHVLVSVELKTITTYGSGTDGFLGPVANYVDGAARLFVALDDKNYNGNDLGSNWIGGDDLNAVIPDGAWHVAGSSAPTDDDGTPLGNPEYTLSSPTIPSDKQPLGLPATATYVDNIYKVELAEFLLFTGVTLDTSVEKNRRLFITNKDRNGDQFPFNPSPTYIPINKEAVGDPATWEPGADLPAYVPPLSALDPSATGSGNKELGMPAVDFTKCSFNWMMGRNVGSAKSKVVTTGKIKAYSPDPKLESGS